MHSKRRTLLLLIPLLQHPPILVHVQPSLCSLWVPMRGVQGWSCLCVQTQVCSALQAPCKWEPLPLWVSQRATAAVPGIREQRLLWEAVGWRAEKWHGAILFPPCLDSVAWVSQTRSLKAAGNVSFKCLIYFLCKRKVWLSSSQSKWDFEFPLSRSGSSCDTAEWLSHLTFLTWFMLSNRFH